jgi:hypothetical protein
MQLSQDSQQLPGSNTPEFQDDFVSGEPNRLRLLAVRLVSWLFGPPHLPSELIWFLLALVASTLAVEILPQPASYWIDPSRSTFYTFLGIPMRWGLWGLGIHVAYMILIGLVLWLLHIKPAFVVWLGLNVYQLISITESFQCGVFYLPFENPANCSQWHTVALVLAGVIWGLTLLAAARLGLISEVSFQGTTPEFATWRRNLRIASIGWIVLLSVAFGLMAVVTPKPEWRLVQSAHIPPGRTEAALAYDTQRSVAVLFGGTSSWMQSTGWESINDTWEWDGNDWIQLHPEHSPSPRYAAGMAFDEKRGVTVLFGGVGANESYQPIVDGETWEWNGQDWQQVLPSQSPQPRQAHAMFYDPVREAVVIYGGYYLDPQTQASVFLDDAWEWDGQTWHQIKFDQPRRDSSVAILYDRARQLPMLIDGEGLWFWQAGLWSQPNFIPSPPGRWNSELVYDDRHQQVVLFGGFKDKDIFGDTWVYNGQGWQQLVTTVQPPSRNGHNLFYDQTRGTVLLFSGLNGSTFYNDMWELVQP